MFSFKDLLGAIITGAAKTVASTEGTGVGIKGTGVVAGAGGIAGALLYVLSHPVAQHPAAQQAVAIVSTPVKQ